MEGSGVQGAPSWTAGRQVITGVVLSAELAASKKFHNVTLKGEVLVADGRRLWTTLPTRPPEILFEGEPWEVRMHFDFVKGDTITMAVTVTPREDDASRGFGSRPKLKSFVSGETQQTTH